MFASSQSCQLFATKPFVNSFSLFLDYGLTDSLLFKFLLFSFLQINFFFYQRSVCRFLPTVRKSESLRFKCQFLSTVRKLLFIFWQLFIKSLASFCHYSIVRKLSLARAIVRESNLLVICQELANCLEASCQLLPVVCKPLANFWSLLLTFDNCL